MLYSFLTNSVTCYSCCEGRFLFGKVKKHPKQVNPNGLFTFRIDNSNEKNNFTQTKNIESVDSKCNVLYDMPYR